VLLRNVTLSAAAISALCATTNNVHAVTLVVNGTAYDVTTFTGSFDANLSKFETAANGGVMPWWGNASLASAFALAALAKSADLGFPNPISRGPYFAVSNPVPTNSTVGINFSAYNASSNIVTSAQSKSSPAVYAQAQAVAAPVPAPLPILGAIAAYQGTRRLQRLSARLKHTSPNA
jgi:hypothetical protein